MADSIYLYKLATAADMAALKSTWEILSSVWLGVGSTVSVSHQGFVTLRRKSTAVGALPADEPAARKAANEALQRLFKYAGNITDEKVRRLVLSVAQYAQYANTKPAGRC